MTSLRFVSILAVTLALCTTPTAHAYLLAGNSWPSGTIPMLLQLDATKPTSVAFPLNDGATSWNSMAASIFTDWNAATTRTKFTSAESTGTTSVYGNKINNVVFAGTIYGEAFDSRTLAVTLSSSTFRKTEADVLVNSTRTWNSYRGTLRTATDLRRVLLHEFGHVLALNHPDQDTPAQSVSAIMNSTVSNVETPQSDDAAAATYLYGSTITKPVITTQPVGTTVNVASSASLSVTVNGSATVSTDALHANTWYFSPTGSTAFEELFTTKDPTKPDSTLAQLGDAGRYYLSALTPDDTVVSTTVTLTVNPITVAPTTQLANVATRGVAGTGANSLIVGFVITGSKPKQVLLRAVGPGLAAFGVPGTLVDPILTLQTAANPAVLVATNNNWEQQTGTLSTVTPATISSTAARVGAFALKSGSKDAVILVTLAPGGYTALVSSPDSSSGVVILEAYDADTPLDPAIKLANLSTRGFVGTGGDIIIAGFVVSGPGPKTYLVRAIGPTLADAPFNLPGALLDPYLKIYRGDTLLRENDDWDSPAAAQPTLRAAAVQVGAFALRETRNTVTRSGLDAVMLITLPPGSYTAQMSGLDGATGIALVEVYEMPN
ncbi:MAG: matrixin family metalloprotease [Undibacterium sp.]|nr:matrixin family metalloprotease [Opitutaceae bacterium]